MSADRCETLTDLERAAVAYVKSRREYQQLFMDDRFLECAEQDDVVYACYSEMQTIIDTLDTEEAP